MAGLMNKQNGQKLLLKMGELLDAVRIPFFLIQGTALGAYRDRGFTPTEADIDLGVLVEEFTQLRVLELISACAANGYDLETYSNPFKYIRTLVVWGEGCKIDIVSFARYKDKRFAATPVRPWVRDHYAIVHEHARLENYDVVELFGRRWNVPSPIETYLESEYGPDWRTPRRDHVSRLRVANFLTKEQLV